MDKETSVQEGIFWVVIGGLICFLALRYDLGSFHAPGAGFVAFLTGLFAGAMGLIMIVSKAVKGGKKIADPGLPETARTQTQGRLIYTVALLVAYAVLMDPLGYILSTVFSMFGLFLDWEKKNWFWSGFFALATTLASYLVFEVWLRCQLPRGIFPWW